MSEPMSNHEIEDVLSSIRRLVSEDLRPAPRQPAVSPEPAAEKLLLTPALRVVEAEPDRDIAEEPAQPVQTREPEPFLLAPEMVADPDPAPPREVVVSRLAAAVVEEEWESPVGDAEVWREPDPQEAMPQFVHRAHYHRPSTPEPDYATDGFPEADFAASDFIDGPQAAFDAVEDALPEADPVAPEPTPEPVPLRRVSPPQDRSWADEAEAAVIADLAQEVEEDVSAGLFDQAQGGMMFDEEVLRDLVRDLIREELSGTLGERITRNVRKLVRAEIARALALREFE